MGLGEDNKHCGVIVASALSYEPRGAGTASNSYSKQLCASRCAQTGAPKQWHGRRGRQTDRQADRQTDA